MGASIGTTGLADRLSGLTPVGFQYRRLRRMPRLFHHWECALARLAGHGTLPAPDRAAELLAGAGEWRSAQTDVAVVGGGPAGLAAALVAAGAGAEVTLIERDPALGGFLLTGVEREDAAPCFADQRAVRAVARVGSWWSS